MQRGWNSDGFGPSSTWTDGVWRLSQTVSLHGTVRSSPWTRPLVSPFRRDGSARPKADDHDGAALDDARRRKERKYPELSGDGVNGSLETANFLVSLAKDKAPDFLP